MSGSNSFNICPRCGNSNALNAKYCSRCGAQLKVPEEPVVCHKCHTRNTPMANFCRNCGTTLKVGAETKICPKCGKEVDANDNVCVCGYSFVTLQQTMPSSTPVEATEDAVADTSEVTTSKKVYNTKGGRGWAIAAIVLILLFAYFIIAPYVIINGETLEVAVTLRPDVVATFEQGFIGVKDIPESNWYGYTYVDGLIQFFTNNELELSFSEYFGGTANIILLALTVVFIVTALAHLIVAIVRSCTTKRSKRMNWYFMIMAILSTLAVGLIALFFYVDMPAEGFMAKVASWFALPEFYELGYVAWAIPLYFWFFFLYSLGAKAKVLKEQVA